MNALDWILLALIAAAAVLALRRMRQRNRSGCCGDCASCGEDAACRTPLRDRNRKHYSYSCSLTIGGMTCEKCAGRVESALNALPGVWAKVSLEDRSARVLLKQPPEERKIRQAVADAGYVCMAYREP